MRPHASIPENLNEMLMSILLLFPKLPRRLKLTFVLIQALITLGPALNHAVGREKTNTEVSKQSLPRKENIL